MHHYVSAIEAWEILTSDKDFILIDTRTEQEWSNIGTPDIGNKILRISSHLFPDMSANKDFIEILQKHVPDLNAKLIFMCRTNGRSTIASNLASKSGYNNCFILSDGFEGNEMGPGWKNSNLPYVKL